MTRSRAQIVSHRATIGLAVLTLAGCTVLDNGSGDKLDYRASVAKAPNLDVPPDLTQLTRDSRYQQAQGSAVSAAAFQSGTPAAAAASPGNPALAPNALGELRIERACNERWLSTKLSAEQVWPQLQAFWKERGLTLVKDQPAVGVMETDWAENRAKLPQDFIRATLGRLIDSAYSTGELDKYRTRVERVAGGTEIYITHRGAVEVYRGERNENTAWQSRPADPQLEAELLSRLMLKLAGAEPGTKGSAPGSTVAALSVAGAASATATGRARLVTGQAAATLQVDDNFDRAWRRVGVALDRSGFTVEDRDRTQGVYFVRYIDPSFAGKEEPGLLSKMFSFGKKDDAGSPTRYRVSVKGSGDRSTVTVLTGQGEPETGETGKRITALLLEDLK